jgi:hypothetical protein
LVTKREATVSARTVFVLGLLVTALGLAGCGGSGKHDGVASVHKPNAGPTKGAAASDRHEQALKYVKCMRDHGVDMPDPDPDGRITSGKVAIGDEAKNQAAQQACQSLVPGGGDQKKPDADQIAQLKKYAQCMRDHGINMSDPAPDGGMLEQNNGDAQGTDSDNDAKHQAAQQACQKLQPKGFN